MKKSYIINTVLCAALVCGCSKKQGYEINGEDDSEDSVEVVTETENSDDNVTEAVPAVQEATPNDASNDNEKQKIESIRKKVKALKVIKDTEREIRESTSGAKSLGLIIDKSNENPKIYNIAYGMNGEDKARSEAAKNVWNSPQYRIGDYAKYLGVTPDFLKHYEQFRIVSSEPRENGYRYYPFSQSYRILESMRLRSYGMPLKDIDVALIDDSAEDVLRKLDGRVQILERQIRFQEAVVREHKAIRIWFDRMAGKKEDWHVGMSEEMLFLPHTSQRNFLKDSRIYDILGDWLNLMPMVKSCMHIPRPASLPQPLSEYAWGLLVPVSIAEAFDLPVNDAVRRLPPRKTFFYHFNGKTWPQLNPEDLLQNGVYKKMAQLGLTSSD
ncbi:MAG: MerR family transcriptional regulator, partial [Paludibacteraceae bacterium]|nr:MerR family transcriptional regulator [Paludibacteraceae bacterium]